MIELRDISKAFTRSNTARNALDGVSIRIDAGESVGIVGESGSGKTTLARILLRLLEPTSGRYLFDGRDILTCRAAELRQWRRSVQAVFQNPTSSLSPRVPVSVLVTEPLEAAKALTRRARDGRARELLNLVGLDPALIARYPHQLSGGQRQRVAIARAISTHPRVIVLDEPVSALDVSLRSQILNLLAELRARIGVTYIYVTHDLATVNFVCDRAYVLYAGSVLERISTRRLVDAPDHPYSQTLIESVPTLGSRSILAVDESERLAPPSDMGCRYATRCRYVAAVCHQDEPSLASLGTEWESRCHFAGDINRTVSANSAAIP